MSDTLGSGGTGWHRQRPPEQRPPRRPAPDPACGAGQGPAPHQRRDPASNTTEGSAPQGPEGPTPPEPHERSGSAGPREPGERTGGSGGRQGRGRSADRAQEVSARPSAGGPDVGQWPDQPGEGARPQGDPAAADSAAKIAELEDKWRRALAELDNHRKRTARALDQERSAERARTAAAWLPVLDDLERALEHAEAEPGAVIQGVRSVLEQARAVIGRLGYPRCDDEGAPFDPALHEAVGTLADTGAPDGTVVHVVRAGYGSGDGRLRPAQVVVAKGRADDPAS
jgi:molecular chaperone GrpE